MYNDYGIDLLTHWSWVMHICVGNLTIIGPDYGLSPGQRQAIIWTNAGRFLIGPWGINISEILVCIHTFSFKKNSFENVLCEIASILYRPQCVKSMKESMFLTCNMMIWGKPICHKYIHGLVQEKHNSIANACLFCTNPSIPDFFYITSANGPNPQAHFNDHLLLKMQIQ